MKFLKFNRVWYIKYFECLGLEKLFPLETQPVAIPTLDGG
jgi:hypothetical protein